MADDGNNVAPYVGLEGNLANLLNPFGNGGLQKFSFYSSYGTGYKEIHTFPNSVYDNLFKETGYKDLGKDVGKNVKNIDVLMKYLPQIQIREYAQDSRLMQIYNVFKYFVKGMNAAGNSGKLDSKVEGGLIKKFFQKFLEEFKKNVADCKAWNKANDLINTKIEISKETSNKLAKLKNNVQKYRQKITVIEKRIEEIDIEINDIIGFDYNNDIIKKLQDERDNRDYELRQCKEDLKITEKEMEKFITSTPSLFYNKEKIKGLVFEFPFMLYYQMCTSKTNAVYVLPYSGKIIDQSSGGGFEDRGLMKMQTSKFGMLGQLINFFTKSIRFNTTPVWGNDQQEKFPAIEVEIDLFNDTVEAAANNFVFVNSIMAKNRFIQYHVMQHNPCVYDIKIDGYNRLYMCQANITCGYKGVSRVPSDDVIYEIINNKNQYFNLNINTVKNRKLISIPDVYNLKITFQSLLPNSFNNYLFKFSGNDNMESIVSGSEFEMGDGTSDIKGFIENANTKATQENPEINSLF